MWGLELQEAFPQIAIKDVVDKCRGLVETAVKVSWHAGASSKEGQHCQRL